MANFNDLSEDEKFVFARRFLSQYRLVSRIRVGLNEPMDVIKSVALKYYGGDTRNIEDCIKFIQSKTDLKSLETVSLTNAFVDYQKSKIDQQKKLDKDIQDKEKALNKCDSELAGAEGRRNELDNSLNRAKNRLSVKPILILAGLIALGGVIIASGGIMGVATSVFAFLSNINFNQACTLFFVGYCIKKIDDKNSGIGKFAGWVKGLFASTEDKAKKRKEEIEKDLAKQKDTVKAKKEERAKLEGELEGLVKDKQKMQSSATLYEASIEKYNQLENFEKSLTNAELGLKNCYNMMAKRISDKKDLGNLEDWYNHFKGQLYFNIYNGKIKTQADVNAIIAEAGLKFNEVINPLGIDSTYSEANIKALKNPLLNTTLEEQFATI